MISKYRFVAFAGLFLSSPAWATPSWPTILGSGWKYETTVKNEAGDVRIESKTLEGTPCYRGMTTVTGLTMDQVYGVVADIPGTLRWSKAGVTKAEVLGRSGLTLDYFQYLDVPGWTMASDRFWFLRGTTERTSDSVSFRWERLVNGGAYASRYQAIKSQYPNAVEPPVNFGGWRIRNTGSALEVQNVNCSDVGGSLPTSIQNMATRQTLPDNVRDAIVEARRRAAQ